MLRRDDGSLAACVCGPDIRNFSRIKVGDVVKVTLSEEVAVMLSKDSRPATSEQTSTISRAKKGAKPGGQLVNTTSLTARVAAIDVTRRLLTLRTADGQNKTVRVHPEISLANVNPGDDVGVRLTQAVVVTVTEP